MLRSPPAVALDDRAIPQDRNRSARAAAPLVSSAKLRVLDEGVNLITELRWS